MITTILKTFLTLALINNDNWEQVPKWEMEQGDELIYEVHFEGIKMYHKGYEIIWIMDIDKIDDIGLTVNWNKILVFGDIGNRIAYKGENIKIISNKN